MKIKYYGTGDGYGIPEPFCSCRLCAYAREHGGKDIRTRSQAVIDDIMIDFSKDLLAHTVFYGLDMRKYRRIFVTHEHTDHYEGAELNGRYQDDGEWHVYLPPSLAEKESARMDRIMQNNTKKPYNRVPVIHTMKPFEPVEFDGYRVTALPSNHTSGVETLLYIVEHDGKSVFWIHDSGLLTEEAAAYLRTLNIRFDAVSMDCTLGRGSFFTPAHMDILQCSETKQLLADMGRINRETVCILSHIGHLIDRTHDELCAEAEEFGFIVAYDTMEIDV